MLGFTSGSLEEAKEIFMSEQKLELVAPRTQLAMLRVLASQDRHADVVDAALPYLTTPPILAGDEREALLDILLLGASSAYASMNSEAEEQMLRKICNGSYWEEFSQRQEAIADVGIQLAELLFLKRDFAAAGSVAGQFLERRRALSGTITLEFLILGMRCALYQKAIQQAQELLQLDTLGVDLSQIDDDLFAKFLFVRGALQVEIGDTGSGREALLQALNLLTARSSTTVEPIVPTLTLLAELAELDGEFSQAEEYYRDSIVRIRDAFGPEDPILGTLLIKLSGVVRLQGDAAMADEFLVAAYGVLELNATIVPDELARCEREMMQHGISLAPSKMEAEPAPSLPDLSAARHAFQSGAFDKALSLLARIEQDGRYDRRTVEELSLLRILIFHEQDLLSEKQSLVEALLKDPELLSSEFRAGMHMVKVSALLRLQQGKRAREESQKLRKLFGLETPERAAPVDGTALPPQQIPGLFVTSRLERNPENDQQFYEELLVKGQELLAETQPALLAVAFEDASLSPFVGPEEKARFLMEAHALYSVIGNPHGAQRVRGNS